MNPKVLIAGIAGIALVFGVAIGLGIPKTTERIGDLPDGGIADGGSMTELCEDNTVKCGAHCIPIEVPCDE